MSVHTPIHKGRIEVSGLILRQSNDAKLRLRILQHWQPDINLYELADKWILLYEHAFWIGQDQIQGLALVSQTSKDRPDIKFYTTAPLTEDEIKQSRVQNGGVIMVEHNVIRLLSPNLEKESQCDISSWVCLEASTFIQTQPLGRPTSTEIETIATGKDIKGVLGGMKASEAQQSILNILHKQGAGGGGLMPSFLAKWALKQRLNQQHATPIRDWLSKSIMGSALGSVLARQQAKYFEKMLQLFEKGDLLNALKHAIPLSSLRDAFEKTRPSLGIPKPRSGLGFDFGAGLFSGASFSLEDKLMEFIRSLYRQSFTKLDAAGKIKEAAYVLSELLREDEEAISYLEKHQEFIMAAELAEGRCLAPAVIIRQWLLAKNVQRALLITRITGSYSAAITLLKDKSPELLTELQTHWAQHLASTGQLLLAAELMVEYDKQQALQWLEEIPKHGSDYAKSLVLRIGHYPEQFPEVKQAVETLLEDNEEYTALNRYAFCEALLQQKPSAECNTIARMTLRSALRDYSRGILSWDKQRFLKLVNLANDHTLKADIQSLSFQHIHKKSFRYNDSKVEMEIACQGGSEVHQVCRLNDQQYLIALGAAGAVLINQQGKVHKRFSNPTHDLIPSIYGNRVILLGRKGEISTISVLEVNKQKLHYFGELRTPCFAQSFDGDSWLLGESSRVMAMDLSLAQSGQSNIKAIWSVGDLPGEVRQISYGANNFAFLLEDSQAQIQRWCYRLPSYSLDQREPFSKQEVNFTGVLGLDEKGIIALAHTDASMQLRLSLVQDVNTGKNIVLPTGGRIVDLKMSDNWLALTALLPNKSVVSILPRHQQDLFECKMQLNCKQANELRISLTDSYCLLWSACGSITEIDLNKGALWRHIVFKP